MCLQYVTGNNELLEASSSLAAVLETEVLSLSWDAAASLKTLNVTSATSDTSLTFFPVDGGQTGSHTQMWDRG